MRPTLLKSFFVVVIFWFFVTTFWWSVQDPAVNYQALVSLKELFPFIPLEITQESVKDVNIFHALGFQLNVLTFWTLPLLMGSLITFLIGYSVIWFKAKGKRDARTYRESGHGEFRGLNQTIGEFPTPRGLPREEIEINRENELFGKMTEKEANLLGEIVGTLAAHPDAYAGEGISVPLMEYTESLIEKCLNSDKNPGLTAIVAAAHQLGKITAYKKSGSEWNLIPAKTQEKEAATHLSHLPAWFALPPVEKNAVLLAVKYNKTPRFLPELDSDPETQRLAKQLLSIQDNKQAAVIQEEKQKTIEKIEENSEQSLSDIIFEAFLRGLPSLSFQNRGLPKGVAAVAWKTKSRVYMLEIKLRETVLAKLPSEVRGALTNSKEKSRIQPFTSELFKALKEKGWLVTEIDPWKVDSKEALWNVKAGKLEFKGVIIVDVPEEYLTQLPSDDSMYEVTVTGTLFNNNGGTSSPFNSFSRDALGSVLTGSPQTNGLNESEKD